MKTSIMKNTHMCLCIILILLLLTPLSSAQVTRILNKTDVYPNEVLSVQLIGDSTNITKIVEKSPFRVTHVSFENVNATYTVSDNIITININNITRTPFRVYYDTVAPTSEGTYTFNGSYYISGKEYTIRGDKTVYVTSFLTYDTDVEVQDERGNIILKFKDVKKFYWDSSEACLIAEYSNVSAFTIDVSCLALKEYWIEFVNLETHSTDYRKFINGTDNPETSFSLNIPDDISAGKYYIIVKDTHGNVILNSLTGCVVNNRVDPFVLDIYENPQVSIVLHNENNKVAFGDYAVFEIKIKHISFPALAYVYITGPISDKLYWNGHTWTTAKVIYAISTDNLVLRVDTELLKERYNAKQGSYTLNIEFISPCKILKTYTFTIEDPSIRVSIDRNPVLENDNNYHVGQKIIIDITSNVAYSSTEFDKSPANRIYLRITAGDKYLITKEGIVDPSANVTKNITSVYTDMSYFSRGVPVSFQIPLSVRDPIGIYKIELYLIVTQNITKKWVKYINIREPIINITQPSTVYRGEKTKIFAKSTLYGGISVQISLLEEPISTIFTVSDNYTINTDSSGCLYDEVYVRSNAKKDEYTIIFHIVGTNYSYSKKIKVLDPTITAYLDKDILIRGDRAVLHIEAPKTRILLFADEPYTIYAIWKNKTANIGGLISKTKPFNITTVPEKNKPFVLDLKEVNNNSLDLDIYIDPRADTGIHTLYVVATEDNIVDLKKAIFKEVPFKVYKVQIIKYPDIIELPKGSLKTVDLGLNVYADFVERQVFLKLMDKKIYIPNDVSYNNSTYTLHIYLQPFVNWTSHTLSDIGSPKDALPFGNYTIHIKFINLKNKKIETKFTIPLRVTKPKISITIPDEEYGQVIVGKAHEIIINCNRPDPVYTHLYILIKYGLDTIAKEHLTVINGTATFEWVPKWNGNYTIYIRDSMNTEKDDFLKWYDIPPTSSYAKLYYADDDLLVTYKVTAVNFIIPPPTTTTITPTPTPTPTTPPPVNTTTPTPTKTPKTITTRPLRPYTPPPTTTDETPGFTILAPCISTALVYLLRRRL